METRSLAGFTGPRDFLNFRSEVSYRKRYLHSASGGKFLDAVADTCKARLRNFTGGAEFWRAQAGYDWTSEADGRRISGPHSETRMRPWQDRAYEGRVNAKGIPCLYLATTREVAMSEVRPWIGSILSVARFILGRDLTVVDCSKYHGLNAPASDQSDSEEVTESVWAHIDYAFSRPVTRSDNTAEYAATQILAEVFRTEGYDGVIYKSAFAPTGYNIALFDLNAALQTESYIFEVSTATFEFRELTLD
jgi:RES domain-containing protein